MDTNKMRDISREQFETWHRSVVGGEPPHEKYNSGDYRNQHVQRYWLGWQASRQAVEIELPPLDTPVSVRGIDVLSLPSEGRNSAICECRSAIEAQGLRVKP